MKDPKYNLAHRLLHWSIAFSLLFMLLTIFLRLNWMNKHNMADIMISGLADLDITISEDNAVKIAKSIRKPMWDWHVYIGYVLAGLYLLRMLFFVTKGKIFFSPLSKIATAREKFQSLTYILFYILLFASLLTGVLIVWGPAEYKHDIEETHKLSLYWLVLYILIHFAGLFIAELGTKKGIVYKMITGRSTSDK